MNATATLQLLAAARQADVPRFVYVSSSEVYGGVQSTPIRGERISEDHPAFPCTVYGGSKLAGESYARAYFRTYGYPTVVVRPFNTYGPRSHHEGDSGEVIPKFLLRCLAGRPMVVFGDGSQSRDFTYVSDTAAGILLAGEHPDAVGETINIGSGTDVTIRDLARLVAIEAGRPDAVIEHDEPRPGDVYRLIADVSRARALLGFEPRVSMSEGLQRLLQWYRDQPKTPEELLEQEIVRNWIPASNTGVTNTTALIPVARPWLDERDADAARRAILSGWVTQGPEVAAFEREFAAAVGAPHACAVSSCTTALHLALLALGVGPGDEVITVSHSFIATANAVRCCGATPVFVDVTSDTFNIDPSLVEPAMSERTKAILVVHQLGMPCELAPILAICTAARRAGDRGRRLRDRQRAAVGRAMGTSRPAACRHRLLLVPSA